MTEKLMHLIQEIALSLQDFGTGAYFLVSLLVLAETIVGIGQFIPGSVFLVFVGFLCYMQVFDLGAMIASVFISHYLGEMVNYALGRTKGRALFREESRFFRPSLLEAAERQFHGGGGKILVFGQFLGMLRPIISLAAGITHYPLWRFLIFIAIGGFGWSVAPLVLGFFFGASWQKAVRYLEGVSTVLLVGIPTFLLSGWLIRRLAENAGALGRLIEAFARHVHRSPRYMSLASRHPRLFHFFERRLNPALPWGLHATLGWLAAGVSGAFFAALLLQLVLGDRWRDIDLSLVNMLAQIRATAPDRVFLFLAHLGDAPIVVLIAAVAGGFCIHARQMKSFVVIAGSLGAAMLLSLVIRYTYAWARPEEVELLMARGGYSFPGGHFTVPAAVFLAVYYWLWNHPGRPRLRVLLAFIVAVMLVLVGFARLYLGIHFPSDVAAGFFLALTIVIVIATVALNIGRLVDIPRRADLAALGVLVIHIAAAGVYGRFVERDLPPPQSMITVPSVPPVLAAGRLIDAAVVAAPRAAETILGVRSFPTNVLVVPPHQDDLTTLPQALRSALERSGWNAVAPWAFFTRQVATPVFPAFINGVPAKATYQKRSADPETSRSILRLWPLQLPGADRPVWIGSVVGEDHRPRAFGLPGYYFSPDVDLALANLADGMKDRLSVAVITSFRPRGLYSWKRLFFTHGPALLIDVRPRKNESGP